MAITVAGANPRGVEAVSDTATTDTTYASGSPVSHRTYSFNDNIAAAVHAGVTVSGFGLSLITTLGGAFIGMTNKGAVTVSQATPALEMTGNRGPVTYEGPGTLTNNGSGVALGILNTGDGTVSAIIEGNVFANTGRAVEIVADDGTLTFTQAGTTIRNATGSVSDVINLASDGGAIIVDLDGFIRGGIALDAESTSGNITVDFAGSIFDVQGGFNLRTAGAITVNTSGFFNPAGTGIDAVGEGAGRITINMTGGSNGADTSGIVALAEGTGGILINTTGGEVGSTSSARPTSFGISARSNGAAGNIEITSADVFATDHAIQAIIANASSGNIAITANGTTDSTTGNGIDARINNAASSGSISVTANAQVVANFIDQGINIINNGTGSATATINDTISVETGRSVNVSTQSGAIAFNQAFDSVITTSLVNPGNSNVVLTTVAGDIHANFAGTILTAVDAVEIRSNSGDVTVDFTGTVTSLDRAAWLVITNGAITFNSSGNVTAGGSFPNAIAVNGQSGGDPVVLNITGGQIHGSVGAGGVGLVQINMTGGQIGTAVQRTNTGIFAAAEGPNSAIDITSTAIFSVNKAIHALIADGSISINVTGAVDSSSNSAITLLGGVANVVNASANISGVIGLDTTNLDPPFAPGSTHVTTSANITGTGGTAVQFAGVNNTLELITPSVVSGNVIGSGNDTLRLNGTGTGSFNMSQLGSGFTQIQKLGASTWTLTGGSGFAGLVALNGGTLDIAGASVFAAPITFGAGAQTLRLQSAATGSGSFANTLDDFGAGDAIDLRGLSFSATMTAALAGGILTVSNGSSSIALTLTDSVLGFLLQNDGAGGTLVTGVQTLGPEARDFNADAKSDILFQHDTGALGIWLMDGVNVATFSPAIPHPGAGWHAKDAGDFNADGKADILWQNDNGTPAVWLFDGFDPIGFGPALSNPGPEWHEIAAADFNGDGKADIFFQHDNGAIGIWLMDGVNVAQFSPAIPHPGDGWHAKDAADFDGDGKADVLWQHDNGTPAVWRFDGLDPIEFGPALSNPGPEWHALKGADFNGDGRADILFQHDNGAIGIWLMDGVNVAQFSPAIPHPGDGWHATDAGDTNSDGKADTIWQHDNGTPAVWLFDGLTPIQFGPALPNPGAEWHVI